MFAIFARFLILFLAIVIQFSILGLGVYETQSPSILLVLSIVWVMILGFSKATGWLVSQGVMVDLFLSQPVGYSVIIFIIIGYGVSFLSKRYLVEHRIWGNIIVGGFIMLASVFYFVAYTFFSGEVLWKRADMFSAPVVYEMLFVFGIHIFLFWILYKLLSIIEQHLSFYEKRIQPKNYA